MEGTEDCHDRITKEVRRHLNEIHMYGALWAYILNFFFQLEQWKHGREERLKLLRAALRNADLS
jgi:hypothetical protein